MVKLRRLKTTFQMQKTSKVERRYARQVTSLEDQNYFLHRKKRPFWDGKEKRHNIKQCTCGARHGENGVVVIYAGAGDFGCWNVYCLNCERRATGKTEAEAVENWNRGDTYSGSNP